MRSVAVVGAENLQSNRVPKLLEFYGGRGCQVTFFGCERGTLAGQGSDSYGATVEYLLRGEYKGKLNLVKMLPPWVFNVARAILRLRPSLVHVLELDSAIGVWLAALKSGVPYIYDVMDNYDLRYPFPWPVKKAIQAMDSLVIGRSSTTIVPDIIRVVGPFARWKEKMLILPNCPPDVLANGASIQRRKRFTLLALGYLSDRRGVSLLLDAVDGLDDVSVIMAGKFDNPKVEERARSMPNIELTGWIPYEKAVLLGCEGHLMYSFYDPGIEGNVLANSQKWFDAMMCGIPVLVNSEVTNAPWIEKAGFGLLCPYGDASRLRLSILRAKSDLSALDAMGRRGRKVFERDFDWSKRQLDLERAVDAALDGKLQRPASLAASVRGD